MKVRCAALLDLERIVGESIKGLSGVVRTRTTIALSAVKETPALPLPALPITEDQGVMHVDESHILTRGFTGDDELETLVRAFETCAISREAWDHTGHIAVALVYAERFGEEAATVHMREALLHFAKVNNIVPAPGRGYHETLTHFWMRMVVVFASTLDPTEPLYARANATIDHLGDKNIAKRFYSAECLASDAARESFVMPDLAELPSTQQRA